jgi:hypothetical protein
MEKRMESAEDTHYLYGSFYSSAAVVIGYLIRLEPFTSLHIELQGGKFDHASRLFGSIPEAWNSVREVAMDFRELIPEFFYLPDFLVNSDKFNFGEGIEDVVLPKWAESPTDFIIKHRAALESGYVSARLPRWIDLIFGTNSRGVNAERTQNLFCPFFFEYSLGRFPDRVQFIQSFVACFGQAPTQLFNDAHHVRVSYGLSFAAKNAVIETKDQKASAAILALHHHPTLSVVYFDERFEMHDISGRKLYAQPRPATLRAVDRLRIRNLIAIDGNFGIFAYPYDFMFLLFCYGPKPAIVRMSRFHSREITCVAISENYYAAGSNDTTVSVWKKDTNARHCVVSRVLTPVSCIALSERSNLLVSCGKDGAIITTALREGCFLRKRVVMDDPKKLGISRSGHIYVTFAVGKETEVKVFDANLNEICSGRLKEEIRSFEILDETDGKELMILGTNKGQLMMKRIPGFETVWCESKLGWSVSAMKYDRERRQVLLGLDDGSVMTLSFS